MPNPTSGLNIRQAAAYGRKAQPTIKKERAEKKAKAQEELATRQEAKQALEDVDVNLIEELRKRHEANKAKQEAQARSLDAPVLFQPHPGPQTDFLASTEYEVGFFGGRGSGKSMCLLVDPLRFVTVPTFKGLMVRKTMPALKELISRAKQIYPKMYPGTIWKEHDKTFYFPSGATLEFGYFDHIDDYDRYHGREFAWLGIDEITQYTDIDYYDKIKSVVRNSDPMIQPRVRCTCNPSGPGRVWVKEYFEIESGIKSKVTLTEVMSAIGTIQIARKYIISTILDNPTAVQNDPQYIAYLESLPTAQRKQWLEGDFEASEGAAFEEFNQRTHVIEPFDIPQSWLKIRAIDWGFRSKAVCLWLAFNKEGDCYVYREYVTTQVHSDVFAQNVLDLESKDYISYGVMDGQAGVQSGINGPTVEEDFMKQGLFNQHADKKAGSRIHSKQLVHKYLRIDPITEKPRLQIFNNCKQIIKELGSLMIDPNNTEDTHQRMEDHSYDCLRYALSSRPDPTSNYGGAGFGGANSRLAAQPIIVNTTFGY